MNSFETRSGSQKLVRTVVYTFIPMFLLAFLGLQIAVATWLFFEIILLVTFGVCLLLTARNRWELRFENDTIRLYNIGNRQSYFVEKITQGDLLIKQTEKQKKADRCDLKIADTIFQIYDVERCEEMKAYIAENFPR